MPLKRSDRMIYLRVLGPLVLAIITLVLVSVGGFQALSAARAYVGGESLWSKARSQTIAHLRGRATMGSTAPPCQPLTDWLAVPLGDRAARLALEPSPPDLGAARAGFLRGGNHPADLYGLIHLYLKLIERLRALGERFCAHPPGAAAAIQFDPDLRELSLLDAELIEVEKHFSASLGHSARMTEQLLIGAILLLAVLLAACRSKKTPPSAAHGHAASSCRA